jgi:hypothetical protein
MVEIAEHLRFLLEREEAEKIVYGMRASPTARNNPTTRFRFIMR